MKTDTNRYFVTENRINHPDIGFYNTYGIIYQPAAQAIQILDISPNAKKVIHMVMSFNQSGLAPEHFRDAVEDLLA